MRHQISSLGGYYLEAPDGDWIARYLSEGKPYEQFLLRMAAAVARGGLFVDAGAHIGNHSLYMALSGCPVVAIEPNPSTRAILKRNVEINNLQDQIHVIPVGLWKKESFGELMAGQVGNSGTAHVVPGRGDMPLVTIDELNLMPDVIKVDVEGLELGVLEGGQRTLLAHRPAVIVESHEHRIKVASFLKQFGYEQLGSSFATSPTFLFVARPDQKRRALPFVLRGAGNNVLNGGKRILQRIPGSRKIYRRVRGFPSDARNALEVALLRSSFREEFHPNPNSNLVVSLTSFPSRIEHAWVPIETMFQQHSKPWKVVLVLAETEFHKRKLPKRIRQQEERGLEVIWVKQNIRSYKKLIPTRSIYPNSLIVTIDDDLFYERSTICQLVDAARADPGVIIGHRGWTVSCSNNAVAPYVRWPKADRMTPSNLVFLTSGAGMLFPPQAYFDDRLSDMDLAEKLCPHADDIWYWAVARLSGVPMTCLGNNALRPLRRQVNTPQLKTKNLIDGENDRQFNAALDYFGLRASLSNNQLLTT